MPQNASRMNSRRLRVGRTCSQPLRNISEVVEVKESQAEFVERSAIEEGDRRGEFAVGWQPAEREEVGALDDATSIKALTIGQGVLQVVRSIPIRPLSVWTIDRRFTPTTGRGFGSQ